MEQLIGQTLNRYKILSLLGEGGMGAVFKARDVTLQRDIALKVMHPHLSRQSNFRQRFLQEARAAAQLDHPGIVQVHDFGQEKSLLYIVMEFIPGANLRQMLREIKGQGKWILLEETIQIIRLVSLALDYAHRQGVLHRDIKPDNIMMKPEAGDELPYRPVLTDLGLARLLHGQRITQEGTSMGTPAYMSPEQALGQPTDARSDVYSLGILFYELATGQLPFPIKSLADAIHYHTEERPPPPHSVRPDLPANLSVAILKALEKNPEDRFPDAAALAETLEAVTLDVTEVAPPTAVETTSGPEAVSLFTQYQQSLLKPRGQSIMEEFPEAPPGLSQDRIQVLSQDKTTLTITISSSSMTIGRVDDNDIMLDDPKASRHHTRIEFDGTTYRVVDLDSTNGTFLGP